MWPPNFPVSHRKHTHLLTGSHQPNIRLGLLTPLVQAAGRDEGTEGRRQVAPVTWGRTEGEAAGWTLTSQIKPEIQASL